MNLVYQDIRLSNKNGNYIFTQCPHGEIYRVVQIAHISTEEGNSLHFECMKVNLFGKCMINLPNLQQIMVFYRVYLSYIIK